MLSRTAKNTFYMAAGPLMRLNGVIYKAIRAPSGGDLRVQLGPGRENYLQGWVNVDANMFTGKCDVWADLRNPLPFRTNTVSAMYSHHVIEHLPDLWKHFRDVFRCLKAGGVYRFGGPNGDSAMTAFQRNAHDWFPNFPDNRKSIGGRFENQIFCRQEHLTILTESFLTEIATDAGFEVIKTCVPTKETGYPELFKDCLQNEWETDFDLPHTLLLEARKP